jgi:putative acetyltransferase
MNIHTETAEHIHQITEIHNRTFNSPDEGKIVENLRKNGNLTVSLVYELAGQIVGHIAYSPIFDKTNKVIGVGLAPVAVLPEYQRKGIGSELIKEGNRIALSKGYIRIFVLGDTGYYRRFGFILAKEYNYYSEFDPGGEHFMVLGELPEGSEKTRVYYGKEFAP